MGRSSLSTSAEQAIRTLPLMFIAQLPQTSSRQAASQVTGVVFLPCAVTGLRWISIRQEMTLAPLRYGDLELLEVARLARRRPAARCGR